MADPADLELVVVAAVAENGVIGDGRELPWDSVPADRRQYRERVAGHPVILGRRTFDAMREDLPGSAQIVLSRSQGSFDVETAHHASGVEDAKRLATDLGADPAYVLGGAEIFELFLPHVGRMFLSRIPGAYEGDSRFPEWDESEWRLVAEAEYGAFTLREWVRDRGA